MAIKWPFNGYEWTFMTINCYSMAIKWTLGQRSSRNGRPWAIHRQLIHYQSQCVLLVHLMESLRPARPSVRFVPQIVSNGINGLIDEVVGESTAVIG